MVTINTVTGRMSLFLIKNRDLYQFVFFCKYNKMPVFNGRQQKV